MNNKQIDPMLLTDNNHKLVRTVSVSEIPLERKLILEQESYDNQRNNGLYRRYSCEQMIDQLSKIGHLRVSESLGPFKKDESNSKLPTGPLITKTNHFWFQLSSNALTGKDTGDSSQTNRKPIEKAFSCNDIHTNSLETCIKRLNLNPRKSEVFKLPPPPPTPPTPPTPSSSTQDLSQPISSFQILSEQKTTNQATSDLPKRRISKPRLAIRSLIQKQDEHKEPAKMNCRFCWSFLSIFILSISVAFFAITIQSDDLVNLCSPVMNFSTTVDQLQSRVYGQSKAINELTNFLKSRTTGFEIVAIVGGTGVGKSHTANVMKQIVGDENGEARMSTMQYVLPLADKHKDAYKELSACKCNLIILDNIQKKDVADVVTFCQNLRRLAKSYCILTMVLINTQEINSNFEKTINVKSSSDMIENRFEAEGLNVKVIGYESLETEILDHCILDAADNSNVTLTRNDIEEIRKYLITAQSGCKGAYAKVQVIGKDNN